MSLVNLNLNLNLDRTANKIAFCSAVVAGTLYVGYSVARTAFSRRGRHRRSKNDDGEDDFYPSGGGRSVLLRRLSQTTQTDALLGDLDFGSGGFGSNQQKIIIRPKSVQERIRELNVRARQFADAVTAIQGNGGGHSSHNSNPRLNGVSGRSLQVTPWGSPRMLSPIDVRPICPGDHISDCGDRTPPRFSPSGSPSRHRRWHRIGSFKTHRKVDFDVNDDVRVKETELIWSNEKDEILKNLRELLANSNRELSEQEARYLVAALNSDDVPLVAELLAAASNYAAFRTNQDRLREAGLIALLPKLLLTSSGRNVKLKTCSVVSNMALNERNNSEMKFVAASLVQLILTTSSTDPAMMTSCLASLTNVAVLSAWHSEMKPLLHKCFSLLDEGHWNAPDGLSLQSLKLLINLSCNEEMIHSLLAAQAPLRLIYLLDTTMPEEVILRVVTLLANIATTKKKNRIGPLDLPAEDKAAAPDTMYAAVFGLSTVERYKRKALFLAERHENADVVAQAHRFWTALSDD